MFKKIIIFSLLAIGFSIAFSNTAKAESPYDLNYQTTKILELSYYTSYLPNFPVLDIVDKNAYQRIINNDTSFVSSEYNTDLYYFYDGQLATSQQIDEAKNAWNNEKSKWSISEKCTSASDEYNTRYCRVGFMFTRNDSFSQVWSNDTVSSDPNNTTKGSFEISMISDGSIVIRYSSNSYYAGDPSTSVVSGITGITKITNYVIYTDNPNYPPGYEGLPFNDEVTPESLFKPEFSYTVDTTGYLRVTYQKNAQVNLDGYGNYRLFKAGDDWNWNPPPDVLDQQLLQPFFMTNYEYDSLPSAGYYTLFIAYEEGDTYIIAPPGFTAVQNVIFEIFWDGKSFISGNNVGECTVNPGSNIQTCNNIKDQNPILSMLQGVNSSTHGLQAVITAPLNFILTLSSYQNSCVPLQLKLPYVTKNSNFSLPCMTPIYQQHFGLLLDFYQSVLTAIVCYYTFVRMLSSVKEYQNPKSDRIEVASL